MYSSHKSSELGIDGLAYAKYFEEYIQEYIESDENDNASPLEGINDACENSQEYGEYYQDEMNVQVEERIMNKRTLRGGA